MNQLSKSFELSPSEIKNKDFKKTMLGYSPEEVVGFLDQVAKLWLKVQKNEKELLSQIENLESRLKTWESREAEVLQESKNILEKARKEASQYLQEAEARSQEMRKNTEAWLAQVLEEVEEVERRKENFNRALRTALESHYEILRKDESQTSSIGEKLSRYLKQPEGREKNSLLS